MANYPDRTVRPIAPSRLVTWRHPGPLYRATRWCSNPNGRTGIGKLAPWRRASTVAPGWPWVHSWQEKS